MLCNSVSTASVYVTQCHTALLGSVSQVVLGSVSQVVLSSVSQVVLVVCHK